MADRWQLTAISMIQFKDDSPIMIRAKFGPKRVIGSRDIAKRVIDQSAISKVFVDFR